MCVIGEVGSGKTSLIHSLLGDLVYVPPEFYLNNMDKEVNEDLIKEMYRVSKQNNIVQIDGSVSLVQQVPWI